MIPDSEADRRWLLGTLATPRSQLITRLRVVDVVAHEVVAIVNRLGLALETTLLRNLDCRCAVNIQGRRSCLKKPQLIRNRSDERRSGSMVARNSAYLITS